MENTQDAKNQISKSSELYNRKTNTFSSLLPAIKYSEFPCVKKIQSVSSVTQLALRRSHDELLKFQQKRSMCHHRRKMRQGQCNRLPISRQIIRRFSRYFLIEHAQSKQVKVKIANMA